MIGASVIAWTCCAVGFALALRGLVTLAVAGLDWAIPALLRFLRATDPAVMPGEGGDRTS